MRHLLDVEARSFIANANLQAIVVDLKLQRDSLRWIILVTVPNGVDHRFVHGHADLVLLFFVEAETGADAVNKFLRRLHILKIALEDRFDARIRLHWFCQSIKIRPTLTRRLSPVKSAWRFRA